jgi:hypothetical protein
MKEWREDNKEDIQMRRSVYYQHNKEHLKACGRKNSGIRYECECGANVRRGEKKRHFGSKKHTQWQDMYDFIYL